jgi:hypothetical protein
MMKTLLLSAILISSTARGKEVQIQCPGRYPVDVVQLTDVPKGWDGQGRVRGQISLLGASYVEGPITGQSYGEMIGGQEIKTKYGLERRYRTDGQIKEKWLLCRYGGDGSIELFHRVPADITQCLITTKPQKFPKDLIVTATCE